MNELLRTLLFLPPQSSTMAARIDALHYAVILTTMAGAVAVTLAGGYFLIRYRRRAPPDEQHREPLAPAVPGWLEASVIAGLLCLFLGFWVVGFHQYVQLREAPEGALTVYVTAKQWMWQFAYPEGQRSIATLVVPANRPVKLVLTSRDVIHGFYVPDFRVKQDAVPGRYTTAWFEVTEPGRHEILCTLYCGTGHSTMRGAVVALDGPDWDRYIGHGPPTARVAGQAYLPPSVVGQFDPKEELSLVRMGEQVAAEHGCLRCHTTDGTSYVGPSFAGLYLSRVPLEGGRSAVADEAYLTESIMDPLARVHRGYRPVMPSYLGLLPPSETAAILELIKSLRDVPAQAGQGRGTLSPRPRALPPPGAMGQPPGTLGVPPATLRPGALPPLEQGTPIPGEVATPPPAGAVQIRP